MSRACILYVCFALAAFFGHADSYYGSLIFLRHKNKINLFKNSLISFIVGIVPAASASAKSSAQIGMMSES